MIKVGHAELSKPYCKQPMNPVAICNQLETRSLHANYFQPPTRFLPTRYGAVSSQVRGQFRTRYDVLSDPLRDNSSRVRYLFQLNTTSSSNGVRYRSHRIRI